MKKFLLSILLVGLTAVNAAAVTTTFNQVVPSVDLPGYVSNTWDIDTEGEGWLSSALLLQLSSGDIYQDAAGVNHGPPVLPTGAEVYDSYLTGGWDSSGTPPNVMGGAVDLSLLPYSDPTRDTTATFGTTMIDATWGSHEDNNPVGNRMLGRFTLSDTAQGLYSYLLYTTAGASIAEQSLTTGIVRDGVMTEEVLVSTIAMDAVTIGGVGDCVTNEWRIYTVDPWLSSELIIDVDPGGTIYQDPSGGDGPPASPSYDTYLTGGFDSDGTPPNILGAAVDIGGGDSGTPDWSAVLSDTKIDATWGSNEDLNTTLTGNLMLGRFTMTRGTTGTFKFNLTTLVGEEFVTTSYYGGAIVDGEMYFSAPQATLPPIPGDADGDGDVDADDAAIVASNWQASLSGASNGDFNDDGVVNDLDATIMAANWGSHVAASAVPEPSTISMLLLLLAALTVRPLCRITRGERS